MAKATKRRMPMPEDVRDLLTDLLGKATGVEKLRFDLNDEDNKFVTGIYLEKDGSLGGACVADVAFAASSAAALALVPPVVAGEAARSGQLSESLAENFFEVANILTVLLNRPETPHVRMDRLAHGIPADVLELAVTGSGSRYFAVSVLDYPRGYLALLAR
jgi:hypothetical protein